MLGSNSIFATPIFFDKSQNFRIISFFLSHQLDFRTFKRSKSYLDMALGSSVSPNGSQPILLSASPRYRRPSRKNTKTSKDGLKTLRWTATIVATLTFVIYYTCTKLYISSAPDLSITGFIKTAVFTVCMLCNTVPMIASAEAIAHLMRPEHHSGFGFKVEANIGALALVTVSFMSMLIACIVGVCLVVVLRIWHYFFYV